MTEPYRFACPKCDSVSLYPRIRDGGYRCDECGHIMPSDERVDRKLVADGGTDYDHRLAEALKQVTIVREDAPQDDDAPAGWVVEETLREIERMLHLVRFALGSYPVDGPTLEDTADVYAEFDAESGELEHVEEIDGDDDHRTDGGTPLDDLEKPGWAEDDPDGWERVKERDSKYGSVTVHNDVELSPEIWDLVDDEADPMNEVVDFLSHEYRLTVDGSEVYRTPGYEPDRPTLTGEDRGTTVTVEVDVPRDVYEAQVERTRAINEHDDEWAYGPTSVDAGLIDMIDLDIQYFAEGERIDVEADHPGEDTEA